MNREEYDHNFGLEAGANGYDDGVLQEEWKFEEKQPKIELETINIDEEIKSYEDLKSVIEKYIQNRTITINSLKIKIERLTEERDSFAKDGESDFEYSTSSKKDVIDGYNIRIEEIEKELKELLDPSQATLSRINNEITEYQLKITNNIKKVKEKIELIQTKNIDLKYIIDTWYTKNRGDDSELNKIRNEYNRNIEYINSLNIYIKNYEELRQELRNFELEISKERINKINEILKSRNNTIHNEESLDETPTIDEPTGPTVPTDETPTVDEPTGSTVPTDETPTIEEPTGPTIPTDETPTVDEPTGPTDDIPDGPKNNNEECTLESVLGKIMTGIEDIGATQERLYKASNIKIYNKIPVNKNATNWTRILKLPQKLLGLVLIPVNALRKGIGTLFTKEETKDKVALIRERLSNLSEKENEILIEEYIGILGNNQNVPPLVNDLIQEQREKYILSKFEKIEQKRRALEAKINYDYKVIEKLTKRLETEKLSSEEKEEIYEVLAEAYRTCSKEIKEHRELLKKANKLLSGGSLHGLREDIRAYNSKQNIMGTIFAKYPQIASKLRDQAGNLSLIVEFENDPIKVVNAYKEYNDLYKNNTKEESSILLLGSKRSVGVFNYTPYIDMLNYEEDTTVRDLITTIMIISSTVTLVNTIAANARTAQMMNQINQEHNNANLIGNDLQNLKQTAISGDQTIAEGMEAQVRELPGTTHNLEEYAIDNRFNYAMNNPAYKAADSAHHAATSAFDTQIQSELARIQNLAQTGQITSAQQIEELNNLIANSRGVLEQTAKAVQNDLVPYGNAHGFDYQAVNSLMNQLINNPYAVNNYNKFVADLYSQAANTMDWTNLSQVSLSLQSLTPAAITVAAAGAKMIHEQPKPKYTTWDVEKRFAEILSSIDSEEEIELDNQEDEEIMVRSR